EEARPGFPKTLPVSILRQGLRPLNLNQLFSRYMPASKAPSRKPLNLPGGLLLRSLLLRSSFALVCLALIPCALVGGPIPAAAQAPAASLENFTGEYTDPGEPDTPLSFYVQNGRLVAESDRNV